MSDRTDAFLPGFDDAYAQAFPHIVTADDGEIVVACPHDLTSRHRPCALWDEDCIEERCGHWDGDAGEHWHDECPVMQECGAQYAAGDYGWDAIEDGPPFAMVEPLLPLAVEVTWDQWDERFVLHPVPALTAPSLPDQEG